MKSKKTALTFLIIISICLVGNESASAQTNYSSVSSKKINYSKLTPVYSREQVTDVFVDYMLLKNSLAGGNLADAKLTALTMIDVIADYRRTMDAKFLPDPKRFSDDMTELKARFELSTTLEDVRANFSTLNNLFIEFIKSYGLYDKTIYLFQSNDNTAYGTAYWLSDLKTDKKNPYSGKSSGADCHVEEIWTFR